MEVFTAQHSVHTCVSRSSIIVARERLLRYHVCVRACRYAQGGLADTAFAIQIGNAILPALAFVLNPIGILHKQFFSRAAHTQTYTDAHLDPMPFAMPRRLSQVRIVADTLLVA